MSLWLTLAHIERKFSLTFTRKNALFDGGLWPGPIKNVTVDSLKSAGLLNRHELIRFLRNFPKMYPGWCVPYWLSQWGNPKKGEPPCVIQRTRIKITMGLILFQKWFNDKQNLHFWFKKGNLASVSTFWSEREPEFSFYVSQSERSWASMSQIVHKRDCIFFETEWARESQGEPVRTRERNSLTGIVWPLQDLSRTKSVK